MSIQSEINRISGNVANALTAIANKGVTIPAGSNSDDLATLIGQIQTSGGGTGAISIVDTPDSAGGTVRTITAVDISDTTAVAADVAQGKYFYTAAGVKTAGTASGGGGGLEYETGTWTPASDTTAATISFAKTHSEPPFFYVITDATAEAMSDGRSAVATVYENPGQIFGPYSIDSGSAYYGRGVRAYSGNATPPTGTATQQIANLTYPSTDSGSSTEYYSRFWATESQIRADANSRYWRSGRTYKWIAVWPPTT